MLCRLSRRKKTLHQSHREVVQFNQFTRSNFIRMIVLDLSKARKTLKMGNNI